MANNIRKYNKSECITFKSTKGEFGGLSNMAPGFPIKINGNYSRCVELLYQALRFPDYPEIQAVILNSKSPITAKNFGRNHLEKTRQDWDLYKFKIMRLCIEIKLTQNKEKFTELLLSTRDKSIVEYSHEDKVWGACLVNDHYEGINALGRLLMELREKIIANTFDFHIPDIENLKILDQNITLNSVILE